eukprot:gnl/TRDRNA2_/TRDRNA2_131555_c0_seq1.p1 gnl/TRDRNA2_/TRDRNA2_131555_c0~~gnl/TRDRNA2_/TRDRNA2_131555_c0_seq1.p1  ORF type:complete len:203 (-),score=17.60 gnl/TRDRNA2_/TRDRNA2_131555_c0_seq1:45-653(-)
MTGSQHCSRILGAVLIFVSCSAGCLASSAEIHNESCDDPDHCETEYVSMIQVRASVGRAKNLQREQPGQVGEDNTPKDASMLSASTLLGLPLAADDPQHRQPLPMPGKGDVVFDVGVADGGSAHAFRAVWGSNVLMVEPGPAWVKGYLYPGFHQQEGYWLEHAALSNTDGETITFYEGCSTFFVVGTQGLVTQQQQHALRQG